MQLADMDEQRRRAASSAAKQRQVDGGGPAAEDDDNERIGEKTEAAVTRDSSFQDRRAAAENLIEQNPKIRWALYHVLAHCSDRKPHRLDELERFVADEPGFLKLKLAPYFPVHWLEEAFALEELYVDAEGRALTADDVAPLSEDEFDDLIVQYAFRITDVGNEILQQFSPIDAMRELLNEGAHRRSIYLDILEFACEPRGVSDIDRLLRDNEDFAAVKAQNANMAPTVFLDRLASVGGLVYDGGWRTTQEGKELLAIVGEA